MAEPTCLDIGPSEPASQETCQNYVLCLINLWGEPPPGAYFWFETGLVKICFDHEQPAHANYAQAVLLAAPETWEVGSAEHS